MLLMFWGQIPDQGKAHHCRTLQTYMVNYEDLEEFNAVTEWDIIDDYQAYGDHRGYNDCPIQGRAIVAAYARALKNFCANGT